MDNFSSDQRDTNLQNCIRTIEKASDSQITEIIQAVIHRYGLAFPDEEIIFLSLPKEPSARQETLELFLRKLRDGSLQ